MNYTLTLTGDQINAISLALRLHAEELLKRNAKESARQYFELRSEIIDARNDQWAGISVK